MSGYCVALPGGGARDSVTLLLRALVVAHEEQTSEIIRMSPSSADLPSRVAAELPLAGAPTQLHVEPQARTAPDFVSSEDGKDCAGQASVRFTCCTAELPSRLLAEVPRRLVSRDSDPDCHHDTPQVSMVPATVSSASQTKLCGRTAPAPLMTTKLPSISSLRDLAGGTM